jgi:transcriptional regulator with XRE-family HTH domain
MVPQGDMTTMVRMGQPVYKPTYIRSWRKHRRLTLEELAAQIDMSAGHLSMLERGERGYTQETLESIAKTLGTTTAALVGQDPKDPEGLWAVWSAATPLQRKQIVEIAKSLLKTTAA